ncbi:hypothetical protein Ciccas_012972, partial [Cichlidogyrus casuarinus]
SSLLSKGTCKSCISLDHLCFRNHHCCVGLECSRFRCKIAKNPDLSVNLGKNQKRFIPPPRYVNYVHGDYSDDDMP